MFSESFSIRLIFDTNAQIGLCGLGPHLPEVHSDHGGNPFLSSVQSFYQKLMSASRPCSSQHDYPISVCARFQDSLDPRLITGFHRLFPQHSTVQSLNTAHQRKTLQEMLQAAQQADDDFLTVTRIAREAVGLSQAFSSTATRGVGNQATAGAYPSQAETTLNRYSGGGGYSTDGSTPSGGGKGKRVYSCFGCSGPRPRSEFRDGKHVVICVNANNPGVHENAGTSPQRHGLSQCHQLSYEHSLLISHNPQHGCHPRRMRSRSPMDFCC